MNGKQRRSLSDFKVGIFVVVACIVLAVAIFSIGSQVGLFEDQFWAMTYLSNVSGLKPGDVVLLAGIEAGNVDAVRISEPGQLPQTQQNQRVLQEIGNLTAVLQIAQTQLDAARQQLGELGQQYQEAVQSLGEDSPQAVALREQLEEQRETVSQYEEDVDELQEDISDARSRLQNIRVLMRVNSRYRDWIREDSSISLGSIGLLGDKYIEISLGRSDSPAPTVPVERDAWLGTTTETVVVVTGTQQASFEELITGANDILANFDTLSRKVEDIMDSFEGGEGTIGRFFTDPSFYNNLNETVQNANQTVEHISRMVQEITEGAGTVPRLIQDRQIYDRIAASTERLEGILSQVEEGEGTLGKFVNDPSFYEHTNQIAADVEGITGRMNQGEGTLGRLSTDDELYQNLSESIDKLSTFLADIESGKGTLGKLSQDEQLYNNLNEVSSEVIKLLYDFRQNPRRFLTIKLELF